MNFSSEDAGRALSELDGHLRRGPAGEALDTTCRWLRRSFPRYRWVGVYVLRGEMLDLAAWDGPAATEHTRIPIGQGVCGRAAREDRTVIVDDVRAAPEYLACFRETRAEIVVPIRSPERVLGEIDIDGNEVAAFDGSDQAFLERVAERLTPIVAAELGGTRPIA
jgi:L-methionine (R)-S-oxide reductase